MNKCEFMKMPVMFGASDTFRTDGVNTILMRYGKSASTKVPNIVDGVSITTIGATTFNYSDITNVIISDGIEVIE